MQKVSVLKTRARQGPSEAMPHACVGHEDGFNFAVIQSPFITLLSSPLAFDHWQPRCNATVLSPWKAMVDLNSCFLHKHVWMLRSEHLGLSSPKLLLSSFQRKT